MRENFQVCRASKERRPEIPSPQEETDLVERARSGDRFACGILLEKHKDRLVNALYRLCGSYDSAVDLAQEAMFRALKNLKRFEGKSTFYTWLYRIAMNEAMSLRRRKKPIITEELDGEPAPLKSSNPVREAERRELHEVVQEKILSLADELKGVLVLREIEGMSYDGIAQVLDVPIGTVKTRIHKARLEMRKALAEYADGL